MRDQPVELLADIGLGRQQCSLHAEARLVEAVGGVEQQPDLVAQTLADGDNVPRRVGFGLPRQRFDAVEMAAQDRIELSTLVATRLFKVGKRCIEGGKDDRVGGGAHLVGLQYLGRVQHAAQGKQAVRTGRCDAELLDQAPGKPGENLQEFHVDDGLRLLAGMHDAQRRLQIAARKPLLHRLARRLFDSLEPGRQAQARLKALSVDGFDFPRDRRPVQLRACPREAGHAL